MQIMKRLAAGVVLCLWSAAVLLPTGAYGELTPEEKRLNLQSFDYVWKTIYERHFDTTFGGLDWPALGDELRPQVESAESLAGARAVMIDLISRLGLSHFGIIPGDLYENIDGPPKKGDVGGETGLRVRVIDSVALVVGVDSGSPAAAAEIKPGWHIVRIGETDMAPVMRSIIEEFSEDKRREFYLARAVMSRLRGPIGDSLAVTFIDGKGDTVETSLSLIVPRGEKAVFGNLPPFYLTVDVDTLEGGIGYFAFSCFFDPTTLMSAYNRAMKSFLSAPGLIIDIRGNPGGIGAIALGMAGWLIDEKKLYLGTLSTRENELKMIVNPRARTYAGPVALLVDGLSGSCSEFLAGGLQDLGRVRVFGSRTMGAALPSMIEKLPNGDGFQYVFADYVSKSGRHLEGDGVIPDQPVTHTREALLEGRDIIIEAALDWIKEQSNNP